MASLIVRAKTIVTCDTQAPQCGIDLDALGRIDDAALVIENGKIAAVGKARDIEARWATQAQALDVRECVIVPGFVDAHAHPLFAGDREADFAARIRGQAAPLGMLYTIERTREALLDPPQFYEKTIRARLHTMLAHGTTTLETKTGYALHKPGESALLDLIAQHRNDDDVPNLVATFLGAHALPPEFTRQAAYVDYLIDQVIPVAASHGAVYADAFCETGYFSPEESRRYLAAARLHGMRLRLHCDEMSSGGAASMAAALEVDAVDHCNYIRRSRRASDCRARHRDGRMSGNHRIPRANEARSRSSAARSRRPRRAGKRLQSWNLAVLQSTDRRIFRPKALRAFSRRGALRRDAGGGSFAAGRGRSHSRGRQSRFRRPSHGVARRVRLAVWRQSGGARRKERPVGRGVTGEFVRCARAIVSGELRRDYAFIVRDGKIVDAGDFHEVRARARDPEVRSFPADRLVVPGFINGHSHAYQILLRGWADDWPFAKWRSDALYRVVPRLTPDDVYWTFAMAFSEMLAAGITTVAEFFYLNGGGNQHAQAAIRAACDTGIRLILARTWMDAPHAPAAVS